MKSTVKKPKKLEKIFNDEYLAFYNNIFPNPDVILPYTENDLLTYKKMATTDSHITSCLKTLKSKILEQKYVITGNKKHVKFIQDNFDNLNMYKQFEELLEALIYGFTIHYIDWKDPKDNDGQWIIDELVLWGSNIQDVQSWGFDKDGDVIYLGKYNSNNINMTEDNPNSILENTFDYTSDNKYGTSLMQPLFWLYLFKKEALKLWTKLLERFGSPAIIALMNETGNDFIKKLNKVADDLNEIKSNSGVVINGADDVKVLSHSGGADDFKTLIKYVNDEISKVILGSVLMSGDEAQYGSYARQVVDERTLMSRVKYYLDQLKEVMNKDLIPKMIKLNFGEQKEYPTLEFEIKDVINFEELTKLMELGVEVDLDKLNELYLGGLAPKEGSRIFKKEEQAQQLFAENDVEKKKKKIRL